MTQSETIDIIAPAGRLPAGEQARLRKVVSGAVTAQSIIDIHTHLYPVKFGTPVSNATGKTDPAGLMLWGVDELLTYHYNIAELFRVVRPNELTPAQFFAMSKTEQADLIWQKLFIERSPISEAGRGVLTTLQRLGLDTGARDLAGYRKYFAQQDPEAHIDRCMEVANVDSLTMTNDVFDDNERERWLADPSVGDDRRFAGVLRFDMLLCDWPKAAGLLSQWGYNTTVELTDAAIEEARRFLREWIDRVKAIYCAVSLPPSFRYPAPADDSAARAGQTVFEKVVLPVCEERGLPFAMMIGSARGVNPALGDAGDMVGKADIESLTNILSAFPNNRFLVTMLSRECQHEMAVAARKFGNLMVFGCWWFLNNPSLINEITRMRMELLGTSFIPQHSDARVLDQIVYKWEHSRRLLIDVFTDKYTDLAATGWVATDAEIRRDVAAMLRENFLWFRGA